ncbi:MAG: flavodoxin-dependent (E)-4-hydroxy-3-methylbut-2-enyl-diphosphate synthase [Candidatus Omnitrophica bacterium]|nr:flavodoxin-dependent (E)-4-hydroxy-3-methylbut-2-enyl-diphosphate synthase [Candidatus Omnitrophota bacterium]
MELAKRRKTPTVNIDGVKLGGDHPVVIQSMTNTPTELVDSTFDQCLELIEAGSELVRLTVNDERAAEAVPQIIKRLRDAGHKTPIVGDFHYNGHLLLKQFKECAQALSKYRINPGNVGKGQRKDENFETIIKVAIEYNKAVRIGVNWGSLDQELLTSLMTLNSKLKNPLSFKEVVYDCMIESALRSADSARALGLAREKIVLSVKMSDLQDMVNVNTRLANRCDYAMHLGLTEAGVDIQGIASSSAALAILLQQGIGDTIRVSLTPELHIKRSREVEVCKHLLQSMGLRYFEPKITSCPGCGRTSSDFFLYLSECISDHVKNKINEWKSKYPGVERLTIAVMGCVVNGPGESKHADIGISLPGATEEPIAPVFADGKKIATLKGPKIKEDFLSLLEKYIENRFKKESKI